MGTDGRREHQSVSDMQEEDSMKFICKDCGEAVTGRVIIYDDAGKTNWILIDKKVRYWVNKLDGRVVFVEDGMIVDKLPSRR